MQHINICNKKYVFLACILGAVLMVSACESEPYELKIPVQNNDDSFTKEYKERCVKSGGVFTDPQFQEGQSSSGTCTCGEETCMANVICVLTGDGYECSKNVQGADCEQEEQKTCSSDGKNLMICKGSKLELKETCKSGKCENDRCVKSDEEESCTNNKCENGKLYTCEGGKYTNEEACPGGVSCKSGTECGDCRNESTECNPDATNSKIGVLKTCRGGVWNTTNCGGNASCSTSSSCGECQNDTLECINSDESHSGAIYKCVNGEKVKQNECTDRFSCKNDKECGECQDGENYCENDSDTNVGKKSTCSNGVKQFISDCDNGSSCASASQCGVCKDGSRKCENDSNTQIGKMSVCQNGAWIPYDDCTNVSCNPSGISCGNCHNGTNYSCNDQEGEHNDKLTVCANGGIVEYNCGSFGGEWGHCSVDVTRCTVHGEINYSLCKEANGGAILLNDIFSGGNHNIGFEKYCPTNRCNEQHTDCSSE